MRTPLEIVQRQLDAYNLRDLDLFLENFSDDVRLFRPPLGEPTMVGKAQLRDFYSNQRFNKVNLRAELISRTVLGNKVFDRERVWGVADTPIEMVAVFEVRDGLIQSLWSFSPD